MSRYDEWAVHLDPEMPDSALGDSEYEALARISHVLSDEVVWEDPPSGLRDRLLAAVSDERSADQEPDSTADPVVVRIAPETSADSDSPARRNARARWLVPLAAAAAAVIATIGFFNLPGSDNAVTYDLAGTELTPDATATAEVEPLRAGVAITLLIQGLPPAGQGEYYAAWLTGDEGSVGIGSFHWREGGIPIELWSGVDVERYPNLAVTLQQEGEPTVSSGVAVLKGQVVDE